MPRSGDRWLWPFVLALCCLGPVANAQSPYSYDLVWDKGGGKFEYAFSIAFTADAALVKGSVMESRRIFNGCGNERLVIPKNGRELLWRAPDDTASVNATYRATGDDHAIRIVTGTRLLRTGGRWTEVWEINLRTSANNCRLTSFAGGIRDDVKEPGTKIEMTAEGPYQCRQLPFAAFEAKKPANETGSCK